MVRVSFSPKAPSLALLPDPLLLGLRGLRGRSFPVEGASLFAFSSPLCILGVFATLAPKSVWRGVKTSGRLPWSSDHHKPRGILFSVIFLSQILVTIPHARLAPWMRAGAALPSGFSAERARTCFLARGHAALVDLVFRHLTWFWRNSALRRVPKN